MRATRGWWLGLTLALFGCGDDAPCDPGTLGCPCLLDGVCRVDGLSCIEGLCVDGAAGDPKCYSPCVTDMLLEDGSVRVCSEEGLVDGCLEGQTCALGSCVRDSVLAQSGSALSAIGRCEVETDCPDFQTCAGGRCVSNCEHHSDCGSDQVCSKKVCRQRCTEVTPCSTDTQACSFLGACIPLTRASAPIQTPVEGGFSLDATRIDFSTSRLQREITITNRGESEETFIVRKLEERTLDRSGNLSTVLASEGEAPLFWLWMGVGTPRQVQQIPVTVRGGGSETIVLSEPRNPAFNSWTGVLEVESERYGRTRVDLRYSEEVQGRWAGHAYYFGNFETNAALEAWRMDRRNTAAIDAVPNAFLQAWARFRNNQIDLAQMEALVQTTLTGSWAFPRVKELCEEAGYGSSTACAPFGGVGSAAVIPYTSAANVNRIPSGVVELNFVAHLRPASFEEQADPTQCGRPGLQAGSPEHCFVGRIESNQALQYGANPALTLRFEQSPLECQTSGITGCVSYLADFASEVMVGGRYLRPPSDRTCELGGEGMTPFATPWLVPGFSAPGGGDERVECRDQRVPFDDAAGNTFYAGANPIPDGRSRRRRLELIDGAVVDQQVMMLIVREVTPSFDGGPDLESYAYITLTKDSSDLEPEDTRGNRPRDERAPPEGLLDAGCDAALINEAIRRPNRTLASLSSRDRESLAWAMVTGATSNSAITVSNPALESIHTLCVWNEDTVVQSNPSGLDSVTTQTRQLFDAGPDGSVSCPAGSRIIYFALAAGAVDAAGAAIDPAADPCNRNANGAPEACFATLREWVAQGVRIRLMPRDEADFADAPSATSFDLAWTCTPPGFGSTDPNAPPVAAVPISTTASCEDDRRDLLSGKTFFAAAQGQLVYNPLETDIHQAFRYRTQFVSPSGRPGFAPVVCRGESGLVPYCYDAEQIEAVLGRATCALALYDFDQAASPAEQISTDARVMLLEYLRKSFGVLQVDNPVGDPILQQGLERLYAELLITLGDDAYTSSFASRFDIAGAAELAFEGSRFEAGGIDVSGAVGFELYKLYQATQYYERVLDRFFSLAPRLWADTERTFADRYVTQETVTTYLEKVIRASAQLANASSEIARRYQLLNRADLARSVLGRAYTRAYQESFLISALMTGFAQAVSPAEQDQIIRQIELAQRTYRVAMLDMQDRYDRIDDSVNAFGFLPDYVPFPALDEDSLNGLVPMFERANRTLDAAAEQEQIALATRRDFDVDEAAFQNELATVTQNYKARLGEICGTFVGSDGRVYPAVAQFAHLDPELAERTDPCGATKTGALWLKGADIETRALELQRVRAEIGNVLESAKIAEQSVAAQCGLIAEDVQLFLEKESVVNGYKTTIASLQFTNRQLDKAKDLAAGISDGIQAVGEQKTLKDIFEKIADLIIYSVAAVVHFAATTSLEAVILAKQLEIQKLEQDYASAQIGRQCVYLSTELGFTLRQIHLEMNLLELDALNAIWNLQVDLQLLTQLDNERKRLNDEWQASEALVIDAAAAKSDPNVRIYKNDAVINADRSFERALRDAYRATRIFEYYTSQSYAGLDKLFLVRMVDAGDVNLRNYMAELEDALFEFQEQFGNPDSRIHVLSLKDDVFRVPLYSSDGRPLTTEERTELFRARLTDPLLLDDSGFIAVKFSTGFDLLSPLTHNHKILFMEVELFGSDVGDDVARVYVRQKGTGVVKTSNGGRLYYAFEPKTAVINPVVNGFRDYGQDSDGAITGPTRSIFRNYRFRERPFVNTNWELVINKRTEAANEDLNLAGLDDVNLYIYYTDFTNFEE